MIATKSEMRDVRKNPDQVLITLVCKDTFLSANDLTFVPSVVARVLQEYEDIFPEETLVGLSPLRGIERQIDFIPGAALPNHPVVVEPPKLYGSHARIIVSMTSDGYACVPYNFKSLSGVLGKPESSTIYNSHRITKGITTTLQYLL
jgi:hypothetical protein